MAVLDFHLRLPQQDSTGKRQNRLGITTSRPNHPTLVQQLPKIRLKRLSEETGCNILAKAEFMSPGGSIKDRAALYLVKDAEEKGLLKPGGTVVEGTAGNTGIGLAHVCRSKGYNCVIYMPDTQVSCGTSAGGVLGGGCVEDTAVGVRQVWLGTRGKPISSGIPMANAHGLPLARLSHAIAAETTLDQSQPYAATLLRE
jgi:hypothetical protein